MTHTVRRAELFNTLDAILDKIGAFRGHDNGRSRRGRRAQLRQTANDMQLLLLRQP
jgi:hypothetical protein